MSENAAPPSPQITEGPRAPRQTRALIMKGGGIKGLAYVGAIEVLDHEYEFDWFIGTSAGAIAAVLLAAGHSPAELRNILEGKNFKEFFDAPYYWAPFNLYSHRGLFPGQHFVDWLDEILAKKLNSPDRVRLTDLPHRVTVYASRRGRSALKFDSAENPNTSAAHAVRCSMSIPLVFFPQFDEGIRTFDGGIQNNFPVQALLNDHPDTPFVSLFLGPETYRPEKPRFVILELLKIWTEASDAEVVRQFRDRTVIIDPDPIGWLDFKLTDNEKKFLLAAGRAAAFAHLSPSSNDHIKATEDRDQLRATITHYRRRKRLRRYLLLAVAAIVLAGACIWRAWPDSNELGWDIDEFLRRRSIAVTERDESGFAQRVTYSYVEWTVQVEAVQERGQYYLVRPLSHDPDLYLNVHFEHPERDFDKNTAIGTELTIRAQIVSVGRGSVILRHAEILD